MTDQAANRLRAASRRALELFITRAETDDFYVEELIAAEELYTALLEANGTSLGDLADALDRVRGNLDDEEDDDEEDDDYFWDEDWCDDEEDNEDDEDDEE